MALNRLLALATLVLGIVAIVLVFVVDDPKAAIGFASAGVGTAGAAMLV